MSLCNFKHITKRCLQYQRRRKPSYSTPRRLYESGEKVGKGWNPLSNIGRFLTSFEITSQKCRPRL